MPVDNKISNIIGVRIPKWLEDQLNIRSAQNSQSFRDDNNLTYIGNKNAWVRLVSSINLNDELDRGQFANLEVDTNINSGPDSLAKNFVLFGGTSIYLGRDDSGFSYKLRSGFGAGGAYGTLGQAEIEDYGYRPMPGIISARIETKGRLGSLKEATISFKCWDKLQLDIIDSLYFKLGYSMFLEWGNTYYYPNTELAFGSRKLNSSEFNTLDPFKSGLTKEQILKQISKNSRDSYGNYDAMLGIVTNFNFSFNSEGSYDCQLKMLSLGSLADSIKINNPTNLPDILKSRAEEYANTLEEIKQREEAKKQVEEEAKKKAEEEANKKDGVKKQTEGSFENFFETFKSKQGSKLDYPSDVEQKEENANLIYKQEDGQSVYGIRRIKEFIPVGPIELGAVKLSIDGDYLFRIGGFSEKFNKSDNWEDNFEAFGTSLYDFKFDYISKKNSNKYGIKAQVDQTAFLDQDQLKKNNISKVLELVNYDENYVNIDKIPVSKKNTINVLKSVLLKPQNSPTLNWAAPSEAVAEGRGFGWQFKFTLLHSFKAKVKYSGVKNTVGLTQAKPDGIEIVTYKQDIVLNIDDSRLIKKAVKNISSLNQPIDKGKVDENIAKQDKKETTTKPDTQQSSQDATSEQTKSPLSYLSSLELILRSIQVYSLTIATKKTNNDIREVIPVAFSENIDFVKQIFSDGILTPFIGDLLDAENTIYDGNYGEGTELGYDDLLKIHVKYGFATNLMANKVPLYNEEDSSIANFKPVNYKQLLKSYVVPYKIEQAIEDGTVLQHPVYIPLGTLLMILNHSSTLYDANEVGVARTPIIYIDYNPNHNFCLTIPHQLSTDPWTCLIPFEGSNKHYRELFDPSILIENKKGIQPVSGSLTATTLFTPKNEQDSQFVDNMSPEIIYAGHGFKDDSSYRGRIMNILVNIDYLIKEIKVYSTKNDENKVFLKPFLEQIIVDISKSIGNINLMRLSYNDEANTLQIIDDQFIPSPDNEIQVQLNPDPENSAINNNPVLPLFGKATIAKSIDIKTEVSSKLANMIAISANANTANKSTLSSAGDTFGFINSNYVDRYIQNRQGPGDSDMTLSEYDKLTIEEQEKQALIRGVTVKKLKELLEQKEQRIKKDQENAADGLKNLSIKFNEAITSYYSSLTPAQHYVNLSTNYLIDKLTSIKGNKAATRASAMIPISINFTTDGISGFSMGYAFTVPNQLLPYTYTERPTEYGNIDHITKTGFVVTGVSHTIENNCWNTAIKGSMIFLKDRAAYEPDNTSEEEELEITNSEGSPYHGEETDLNKASRIPRGVNKSKSATANKRSNFIFGSNKSSINSTIKIQAHGAREANQIGQWESSNAWDLFVDKYTPIYAIFDGTINNINYLEQGNFVWGYRFTLIGNDNRAWYTHLDRVVVNNGDKVKKGDLLGFVGDPPRPDFQWPTHLHIALQKGKLDNYLKSGGEFV